MTGVQVREAKLSDIPDIVDLVWTHVDSSNFSSLHFDPEVLAETLRDGLQHPRKTCLLAVDQHGSTIGMVAGQITQSWFGTDWLANEILLMVDPGERGRTWAFKGLVREFCRWAVEHGAVRITFGNASGAVRDSAYTHAFQRYGFKTAGSIVYLEV